MIPNEIFASEVGDGPFSNVDDFAFSDGLGERLYFSGRARAISELSQWLYGNGDGYARVITGGAGTGKSALFRRLIGIANHSRQALHINSRVKTLPQMLEVIARAFGGQASSAQELIALLKSHPAPIVLAVDALDESKEPRKIAASLLREIARLDIVHLVVATRPENPAGSGKRRVNSLGLSAVEMDLDDQAYLGSKDVEAFVANWLLGVKFQ